VTAETQQFISVQDIRGFRLRCGHCKAKVSLELATPKDLDRAVRIVSRYHCPLCNGDWASGPEDPRAASMAVWAALARALFDAQAIAPDAPPSVLLEIEMPA
jgi:hypothetical protein